VVVEVWLSSRPAVYPMRSTMHRTQRRRMLYT
jgi:hypothetical protein